MISQAKDIFKTYAEQLRIVEQQLLEIFKSDVSIIPLIGQHILKSGGKRIRPLFLLLSSDLCGYKGENRYLLAAIIEAIHTASLLHDDVIDGADTRRGSPSAHSLWGNQLVILVGDYIYSHALRLAVNQKNHEILEALSEATTKMTEGEILQLHKIADPNITKEEYFRIISAKTGILISVACKIGGILSNQSEESKSALARFGMKTGIVFQLIDDILDYVARQEDLGKKLGKDLQEGKITMPLIYLLKVATDSEKEEIKKIITKETTKSLGYINRLFSKYNAIEESLNIAKELIEEAKSELDIFPPSPEKEAMLCMADYAMLRDK